MLNRAYLDNMHTEYIYIYTYTGWWFGTAVMLELLPVVRLGRTNPRAFSFLTFCHGMWFIPLGVWKCG